MAGKPDKDYNDYLLIKEVFDKGKGKYGWRTIQMKLKAEKSIDSDIHGNVVIDYGKGGGAVKVSFYQFSFDAFSKNLKALEEFTHQSKALFSVK